MELKPGYKQTEVGVIPLDWEVKQLGTFTDCTSGGTPSTLISSYWGGKIPWMSSGELHLKRVKNVEGRITDLGLNNSSTKIIPKNCVLIGLAGQGKTRGTVAINSIELCTNQSVAAIFPRSSFDSEYLFHNLDARYDELRDLSSGDGGRGGLNLTILKGLQIPFPSIEEQTAIATVLSDMDALLDSLDRLIAKKRDIKQAAMVELLTGKTRLPGFEGEWERVELKKHISFLRNGVNSRAELTVDDPVKYLHYGDIHSQSKVLFAPDNLPSIPLEKARNLDFLQDGDLVFADASEDLQGVSKSVEIFNVGQNTVVAGLHTIAVRFDKSKMGDGFKAYLQFIPEFNSVLRRLASGTKVYATNKSHIEGIVMRLPSLSEQTAIAKVLSDMDAEIEALEVRRTKTQNIRQGMMQELLTGKTRLIAQEG